MECSKEIKCEYQKYAEEMLDFIDRSPTCFHAVANLKAALEEQGFHELEEAGAWRIQPGEGCFVVRNGSSLIAFRMPDIGDRLCDKESDIENDIDVAGKIAGFHITAAHSDSPAFKVKESPEMAVENVYVKLNTEKYGGMNLPTWFDRALSVAGRVAVKKERGEKGEGGENEENTIETRLVNIENDLLVIPNVAVHLTRSSSSGKEELNPQVDLLPLYAQRDCWQEACEGDHGEEEHAEKDHKEKDHKEKDGNLLMKHIAQAAGVAPEEILGHDLFLYVREKGRILGEQGEFVLSPRLDDLQCVYTSARGFLESAPKQYINVCAVFDNEEVGSGTKQGANSTFLEDVLWRICECLGLSRSEYLRMIAGSFLISADNAHAVHPNHPEKSDPTNKPYLNKGMVIKFHGSQKYATDAVSAAKMRRLCQDAKAPCQTYANRSDIAGGSTLGNISTSHVSVSSVDVGLPQLAMHSAVETAGVKDTKYAVDIFREFFSR